MTEKYCFMLTCVVYLYRYPDTVGEAACLCQGTAVRVQRVVNDEQVSGGNGGRALQL